MSALLGGHPTPRSSPSVSTYHSFLSPSPPFSPRTNAGGMQHPYPYTQQLLALDACRNKQQQLPHVLCTITTPMKREAGLMSHPDQEFASYILWGIEQGFRVGFDANRTQLRQRSGNLLSATEQPEVIQTYLDKEVAAGRVAKASSAQGIRCSPFGAIPKKSKPGQWRRILDLSSPEGHSVNDGITKELATSPSTRWSTLGAGFTASKNGCKACLPQRPSTPRGQTPPRHGLARRYIHHKTLPFGLRSAPLIFSALADALASQRHPMAGALH